MMDSPFFRSHWDLPTRPRYPLAARPIPVQAQPESASRRPPKLVSIPVSFVGSERSRSDSAVKIQKVFRGFLVRKSLKKISAIRKEVLVIEERISKEETVDLIRRNQRERLRVNEMLMSLLLRLDSVRAADAGVRDCRRSVIKKAIALQEYLDAVVQSGDKKEGDKVEGVVEVVNPAVNVAEEPAAQGTEIPASVSDRNCDAHEKEEVSQFSDTEITRDSESNNVADSELIAEDLNEHKDIELDCAEESQSDSTQSPVGGEEVTADNDGQRTGVLVKEENLSDGEGEGTRTESDRNKELLERMMEENEKMMGMMAELVERNEKQTRLLNSLTQRVEHLERAFVYDKLRRMKKRNAAAGCVESCEKSPDNKKSGKR